MSVVRIVVFVLAAVAALLAAVLLWFPERVQGFRYEHLSQAAFDGSLGTARVLLWLGADPNGADYNDTVSYEFVTPLGTAASRGHVELVALLLESGANPDAPDPTGFTPLIHAAAQGHPEVVRRLLEAGARTDAVSMSGTALDVARSAGHGEVVRVLEASAAEASGSGAVRAGGEAPGPAPSEGEPGPPAADEGRPEEEREESAGPPPAAPPPPAEAGAASAEPAPDTGPAP